MNEKIAGINIQWPWSELIINGRKKVETRGYPIPAKHMGKKLLLIQTHGVEGKKRLIKSEGIAIIEFGECYKYENEEQWSRDRDRHLVEVTDPQFSFNPKKEKWAWVIVNVQVLTSPIAVPKSRGIVFTTPIKV